MYRLRLEIKKEQREPVVLFERRACVDAIPSTRKKKLTNVGNLPLYQQRLFQTERSH